MITMCLSIGITGNHIMMVDPVNNHVLFEDTRLLQFMLSGIEMHNVQIFRHYKLQDCQEYNGKITGCSLIVLKLLIKDQNGNTTQVTNVKALLYADEMYIDCSTIKCMKDAHLIFDDALIIDQFFRTNDKYM